MSALASALGSLLVKFTADASGFSQGCQQAGSAVEGVAAKVNAASGPMAALQTKIESLGTTAVGLGTKLAGGLGLLSLGATAISAAEDFEEADARIARATGATGENLKRLQDSFRNIYASSAASADTITAAMAIVSQRTGAAGLGLETLSAKMIALSKVAGEDVKQVGAVVTRMFGDWSISTDRAGGAMDYLRIVAQQSGATVSRLAETIVYAGAPLRLLGFSFEQAAAMIGKFEKEGANTELVLGGMKAALGEWAKDGKNAAEEWKKLVDGVQSGAIAFQNVSDLVGVKRAADLFAAIKEGRFQIDEAVKSYEGLAKSSTGSITTMSGEWTKLKHAIQAALEPIAAPALHAAAVSLNVLGDAVRGIRDVMRETVNAPGTVGRFLEQSWRAGWGLMNYLAGGIGQAVPAYAVERAVEESAKNATGAIKPNATPGGPDAGIGNAAKAAEDFAQRWAKAMSSLGIESNKFREMEASLALVAQQLQKHGVEVPKVASVYWILMEAVKTHVLTMDQAREAMKKWGDEWAKQHPTAQQVALDMSVNKENLEAFTKAMEAADAKNLGRVFDMIAKSTFDAAFALDSLPEKVNHMAEMTIAGVAAIEDAYKTLGIKSSASLQEAAEKAQSAYYDIEHSATATAVDIQRAWVAMVAAQIDAGEKLDSGTITLYERLKTSTASATKQMQTSWKTMMQQVSTAINDLSKSLTDVIFGTKTIGEAFTDLGKTIVRIILEQIIANGISKLMGALSGVLGQLGKVGQALGGIFGGGGGVLGTSVGAAGGAASTIGSAASGTGGAASVAGTAASGAMGIIGIVANVGSLVSGIVGNFQMSGMNKTLDLIEASTRYTWLAVGGSGTAIAQMAQNLWAWAQNYDKTFWGVTEPLLTGISANTDSMVALLSQISGFKGGSGSGITITVNGPLVQVSGSNQSADAIAAAVMRAIPTQIKRYTNSFAPVY